MGCDPLQWIREGLVDAVIVEDRLSWGAPEIARLVSMCRETRCRAIAGIARPKWGRENARLHPYRIEREVENYLNAGADGISFYETAVLIDHPEASRAIRRINDPGHLPSRAV
jgi:hypothetical protein